eukprot:scaffold16613_cov53-Cyclotella_meneghiniana.AAC.1
MKHLISLRISSVPPLNLGTKKMKSRWKSATEFTKSTIGYREEFLREYGKIWCRGWTLSFSMVREALKFENELETKEMSFTRRSANEPKSDFHNLS